MKHDFLFWIDVSFGTDNQIEEDFSGGLTFLINKFS